MKNKHKFLLGVITLTAFKGFFAKKEPKPTFLTQKKDEEGNNIELLRTTIVPKGYENSFHVKEIDGAVRVTKRNVSWDKQHFRNVEYL